MPTYVYECKKCQLQFEADQRITEEPLKDCSCGAKGSLKRLIQPIAVMFKGSGFHINDYAPKASGTEPTSKVDSAPSTSESSESKTDATALSPSESSAPASEPAPTTVTSTETASPKVATPPASGKS